MKGTLQAIIRSADGTATHPVINIDIDVDDIDAVAGEIQSWAKPAAAGGSSADSDIAPGGLAPESTAGTNQGPSLEQLQRENDELRRQIEVADKAGAPPVPTSAAPAAPDSTPAAPATPEPSK